MDILESCSLDFVFISLSVVWTEGKRVVIVMAAWKFKLLNLSAKGGLEKRVVGLNAKGADGSGAD